jgi:hypothetical protein
VRLCGEWRYAAVLSFTSDDCNRVNRSLCWVNLELTGKDSAITVTEQERLGQMMPNISAPNILQVHLFLPIVSARHVRAALQAKRPHVQRLVPLTGHCRQIDQ